MTSPEHTFDADVLILGGGCAGLSLATRLATRCPALRVTIIEPRTHYTEDRTWCGWRTAPHPYTHCVAATWPQWRVICNGRTIARESDNYSYEMLPAAAFYQESIKIIRSGNSVCLALGASALSVVEEATGVTTCLDDGRRLASRWVVDTRPPLQRLAYPSLWQNFVGFEVQADQRWSDRLGTTPVLMDFQPAGACAVQFMYVLPLGGHRFLCEWTRFSPEHGETIAIEASLHGWLKERGCTADMIERRESGCLPMSVAPVANSAKSRVIAAGTRGGSMRASTGYAFHAIQRWADRCADSLAADCPPLAPERQPVLAFLDEVFLTALQQRSTAGETIFSQLFAKTDPDALVRFLSGVPQSDDILAVMLSLPWFPFSKAAIKTLWRKGAA